MKKHQNLGAALAATAMVVALLILSLAQGTQAQATRPTWTPVPAGTFTSTTNQFLFGREVQYSFPANTEVVEGWYRVQNFAPGQSINIGTGVVPGNPPGNRDFWQANPVDPDGRESLFAGWTSAVEQRPEAYGLKSGATVIIWFQVECPEMGTWASQQGFEVRQFGTLPSGAPNLFLRVPAGRADLAAMFSGLCPEFLKPSPTPSATATATATASPSPSPSPSPTTRVPQTCPPGGCKVRLPAVQRGCPSGTMPDGNGGCVEPPWTCPTEAVPVQGFNTLAAAQVAPGLQPGWYEIDMTGRRAVYLSYADNHGAAQNTIFAYPIGQHRPIMVDAFVDGNLIQGAWEEDQRRASVAYNPPNTENHKSQVRVTDTQNRGGDVCVFLDPELPTTPKPATFAG